MIVVLEPICKAWTHDASNAGLLKVISETIQDECVFIAEKEHLKNVSEIYNNKQVTYKAMKDIVPFNEADLYSHTLYYYELLAQINREYKPKAIFVTCVYRPCILAAEIFSFAHTKLRIHILLHGMVEPEKNRADAYAKLLKASKYCRNLDFLTYGPYCTGKYWGIPDKKMIFIHHFFTNAPKHQVSKEDKMIIGVIGACATKKAAKILRSINKSNVSENYEFWIVSKFANTFKGMSNTKIIDVPYDRCDMEKLIQQMDYVLIPYGKKEYTLSASGIMWDAISNEVPSIFMDCPYLGYYESYGIGLRADSINEICELLIRKIENKERMKVSNAWVDEMELYNKDVIKRISGTLK